MITRLASHGNSLARAHATTVPIAPPEAGPADGGASRRLARCFCKDPAIVAIAATTPVNAATDRGAEPPNPKKCTTVPSAPPLCESHAMAGGTASMSSARAAVTAVAHPTALARRWPRPGPPDTSVPHQYRKRISVIPATMAGASHHASAVTDADAWPWDQVSTPRACSSQPQAWL